MSADCVHHWLLATPDGASEVPGECRHCGEVRTFRISTWDTADRDKSARGGRQKEVGTNG